jgi:hypothetical protein
MMPLGTTMPSYKKGVQMMGLLMTATITLATSTFKKNRNINY